MVYNYYKKELADKVDMVFDCVPMLQKSVAEPYMAKFGGHPNEEGCKLWADRFFEAVKGSEFI